MPRDASGNYTLVAGNPVTPLTPIESSWANSTLDDLATALTGSLSRVGLGGMLAPLELVVGTQLLPALNFGDVDTGFYGGTGEIHMTINGTAVANFTSSGVEFLLPISGFPGFVGPVVSKSTTADPTANSAFTLQNSAGTQKGKFYWTGSVTVLEPATSGDALNIGGLAIFTSTEKLRIPIGTTAQRPASPAAGDVRYNSSLGQPEMYSSLGWMGMVPPGAIMMWGAAVAPAGWQLCDGSEISRTDNPFLFAAYGTTYGAGNGTTTFAVPNLNARMPMGPGGSVAQETFLPAAVNTGTDIITVASNISRWVTGMRVQLSSTGTLPAPFVAATDYYVVRSGTTGLSLSATRANALGTAPTAINITTQGTGVHTITAQEGTVVTPVVGMSGGEPTGHYQSTPEMANHLHGLNGGAQVNLGGGPSPAMTFNTPTANTNAQGSSSTNPTPTYPPYLVVAFIVKLG